MIAPHQRIQLIVLVFIIVRVQGFDASTRRLVSSREHPRGRELKICPPGQYHKVNGLKHTCISCQLGRYKNSQSSGKTTSCNNCPKGQFQPLTGQSKCLDCAVGKYNDGTKQTKCKVCTIGKFSAQVARIYSTACVECVPGQYSDESSGASACKECPAGKYSTSGAAQTKLSVCKACGVGRYSQGTSQISIDTCVRTSIHIIFQ